MYDVQFEPEVPSDSRILKFQIISYAREQISSIFNQLHILSGNILYASSNQQLKEEYQIHSENQNIKEKYTITLRQIKDKQFQLKDINNNDELNKDIIRYLNITMKKIQENRGYKKIGKLEKYYKSNEFLSHQQNSSGGYNIWRGLQATVLNCDKGYYLQIKKISRILQTKNLLDFIDGFGDDKRAKQEIISQGGVHVIASYGNYKEYNVIDIDLNLTPQSLFKQKDGTQISISSYMKNNYKIDIKILNQPIAIARDKRFPDHDIYLVPQLMQLTGILPQDRENYKIMQDIAQFTRVKPPDYYQQIHEHAKELSFGATKFNVEIESDQNPEIDGIRIDPPQIQQAKKNYPGGSTGFQVRETLQSPIVLKKDTWVFVYFSKGEDWRIRQVKDIAHDLIQVGQGFGMQLSEPSYLEVRSNNPQDWINTIKKDIDDNGAAELIVTFNDGSANKVELYNYLKDFLNSNAGVIHQHINSTGNQKGISDPKKRISIISKILIQINAKLNRPPWIVKYPSKVKIETMLVGIDISVQRKCLSVGVVATSDEDFSKFYSNNLILPKNSKTQIINGLGDMILQCVQNWHQENPDKKLFDIVIYRDGFNESQTELIFQEEFKQIKASVLDKYPDIRLALISVNRKTNLRFFSTERDQTLLRAGKGSINEIGNPAPGTFIYQGITSTTNNRFEFYLAAQHVNQGVCTPTKYSVIYNNLDWNLETFLQLTFYQCYNYYNWQGSVRVPSVLQYAGKLAFLVGQTSSKKTSPYLNKSLFFL